MPPSSLILSSIVGDITNLARACVRNHREPDIEVVVSRDMRMVIGEAMNEQSSFPCQPSPHEHLAHARITTLWEAGGCFAIVRLRG